MATYTMGLCSAILSAPGKSGGMIDVFRYLKLTSPWAVFPVGVGLEDGGIGKVIEADVVASAEEGAAVAVESCRFRSWSCRRTSKSSLLPPKSTVIE